MDNIDELIERIENARSDADWRKARHEATEITLTLADCDALGAFLTTAFGAVMMSQKDDDLATNLACLAGAFQGEKDEDEDDD